MTLVLLATAGTAVLVGAAYLMGFNKTGAIDNEAQALKFVSAFAPNETPKQAVKDDTGASALVLCESLHVFLVTLMGTDPSVRHLQAGDITQTKDGQITLAPKDFGFPKRVFYATQSKLSPILEALKQGHRQ